MKKMNDIKNLDEIKGTCYMEVLPDKYKGKCWNADSLYFEEEDMGYFEPIIKQYFPSYDHYAFNEINKKDWLNIVKHFKKILNQLDHMEMDELRKYIGFIFKNSEENFCKNLEEEKIRLKNILKLFISWLENKLDTCDTISILGL